MISKINNALIDYIKQPLLPNKNKLIEFLWAEIIDALKGCRVQHKKVARSSNHWQVL